MSDAIDMSIQEGTHTHHYFLLQEQDRAICNKSEIAVSFFYMCYIYVVPLLGQSRIVVAMMHMQVTVTSTTK